MISSFFVKALRILISLNTKWNIHLERFQKRDSQNHFIPKYFAIC